METVCQLGLHSFTAAERKFEFAPLRESFGLLLCSSPTPGKALDCWPNLDLLGGHLGDSLGSEPSDCPWVSTKHPRSFAAQPAGGGLLLARSCCWRRAAACIDRATADPDVTAAAAVRAGVMAFLRNRVAISAAAAADTHVATAAAGRTATAGLQAQGSGCVPSWRFLPPVCAGFPLNISPETRNHSQMVKQQARSHQLRSTPDHVR